MLKEVGERVTERGESVMKGECERMMKGEGKSDKEKRKEKG